MNNPIENWTLQECKEYLSKYPNGLKADSVKTRLAQLEIKNAPKEQQNVFNTEGDVEKDISSIDKSMHAPINSESSGLETFGKVLLSIGAVALAFGIGWILDLIFDINIKYISIPLGMVLWKEIWK